MINKLISLHNLKTLTGFGDTLTRPWKAIENPSAYF